MTPHTLSITRFAAPHAWATTGEARAASWAQLVRALEHAALWPSEPTVAHSQDRLDGWSMARFRDDVRVLDTDPARARVRNEARVLHVSALVLEYVDEPLVDEEHLSAWWGRWGFLAFTTAWNDLPQGDRPPGPRWRVIVPLGQEVSLDQARRIATWARHPRRSSGTVDATTLDVARVFAVPAIAPGGYRHHHQAGPPLDPATVEADLQSWSALERTEAAGLAVRGTTLLEAVASFQHRLESEARHPLMPWPGGVSTLPHDGAGEPPPRPPSLAQLAHLAGSLWPGRMALLSALGGSGRSALALQLAEAVARAGHPVLYVSLGLTRDEVVSRLLVLRAVGGGPRVAWSHAEVLDGRGGASSLRDACDALTASCAALHVWVPGPDTELLATLRQRALGVADSHAGLPPLIVIDPIEGLDAIHAETDDRHLIASVLREIASSETLSPSWPGAAVLTVVAADHQAAATLGSTEAMRAVMGEPGGAARLLDPLTRHQVELAQEASLVLALAVDDAEGDLRPALAAVLKNRQGHVGALSLVFHGAGGVFSEVP